MAPENPNVSRHPNVMVSMATDVSVMGKYGGLPPDNVIMLDDPIGFEQSRSPMSAELQPYIGGEEVLDVAMRYNISDNEYYLVRFADKDDSHNVLAGRPWMIYGSYLTVQPWNRFFSTKEDHPSQIMVWVKLPRLPYRYYTKRLFRHIAATIGKVVRIDYNTKEEGIVLLTWKF
ncbi:hypothetical protein GQ457_09G010660 [Hibiscus cannabinus]